MEPETIRLSGVVEESIVDGPGLRFAIFTQGCPHGCPGCHNPESHDPAGGFVASVADLIRDFSVNPLLSGVTFSGGEPFLQPAPLCRIAKVVKGRGGNVFTYSGYRFEELWDMAETKPAVAELLELTDTLVDGPYMESLRSLELPFRGSRNQRLLDRDARRRIAAETSVQPL